MLAKSLNISTENFDLEFNHIVGIKLDESWRGGGKRAYAEYLQKSLQYSFFYPIYDCLDFKFVTKELDNFKKVLISVVFY